MRRTIHTAVVITSCVVAVAAIGGCGSSANNLDSNTAQKGTSGASGVGKGTAAVAGATHGSAGASAGTASGTGGTTGGAAVSGGAAGTGAMSGGTDGSAKTGSDATFTAVYAILMAKCSGPTCHVNAFFSGAGLSLPNKMTAYTNLIGAASSKCPGQKRVVPGDPNASVLVQALEHKGGCAPAMPQGAAALSMADINTIVAWIMAGAINN